jgi:hypothetical protein
MNYLDNYPGKHVNEATEEEKIQASITIRSNFKQIVEEDRSINAGIVLEKFMNSIETIVDAAALEYSKGTLFLYRNYFKPEYTIRNQHISTASIKDRKFDPFSKQFEITKLIVCNNYDRLVYYGNMTLVDSEIGKIVRLDVRSGDTHMNFELKDVENFRSAINFLLECAYQSVGLKKKHESDTEIEETEDVEEKEKEEVKEED